MFDLNELLTELVERGGSDLHITAGMPPVLRINGKLVQTDGPRLTPRDTKELLYSILKQEQREKLEREWEFDFAHALPGVARFRVNAYFQRDSLGAAFRHIPVEISSFEELGLPRIVGELCRKPRGFVLVTGPTGSGKSTTLASMVDCINRSEEVHIITVEDPIEYLHQHRKAVINQREVGVDTHSFSSALKYILRQDPDVIMIGEMRDLETVSAALTAAETGHLVFATLHTQDAAQSIDRIIDVFPPYQQQQVRIQLAGTLQGIISQQLLPTVDATGRVLACEVLVPTSGIRNMIREGKTHQLLTAMQAGQQYGMVTMDQSLADLHRRGLVTLDYALQRAIDPNILKTLLGRAP
ncbi:MAG: type IV pilus twitching motility protein PilT [Actinomycetota bacterium]|nr:MAG: twitching motility protein [Actinomycetota bacterium]MDO8949325.1 type IV pilus twitching motility protein PilT [Actinomycetota bacterium]MDP3630695.1 type IV pilus twitching motility protein PilT [Actinomycetota bacterium]